MRKLMVASLFLLSATTHAEESAQKPRRHHHAMPPMTDAQKKCFTDNGVEPPSPGRRPPHKRGDHALRDKIHACLTQNGWNYPPPPPPPADGQPEEPPPAQE